MMIYYDRGVAVVGVETVHLNIWYTLYSCADKQSIKPVYKGHAIDLTYR